jgi:hypothetical protein
MTKSNFIARGLFAVVLLTTVAVLIIWNAE